MGADKILFVLRARQRLVLELHIALVRYLSYDTWLSSSLPKISDSFYLALKWSEPARAAFKMSQASCLVEDQRCVQ
jgi:hypothetical protein